MLTDKRLLTCAELVTGDYPADIGTDHGYLPVYLVRTGRCSRALACDVAKKPLESARAHISAAGLDDRIETVLTDGLRGLDLSGVTDLIIAGMGGELISRILSEGELPRGIALVLQPMTKWDVLRRWLWENGWTVTREQACREGRFVYSVMQCRMGAPGYPCGLRYLYCGRVSPDTQDGRAYLERQASRLEAAGRGKLSSPQGKAQGQEMLELAEAIRAELASHD